MTSFLTIISVASGGAIGAVSRLLISGAVNRSFIHTIPLGTLAVNLLGSLLIGILFAYFHIHTTLSPHIKSFMVTGILGALTTYSTFAMESFLLLQAEQYIQSFANMALNLFGTILFAGLGYIIVIQISK